MSDRVMGLSASTHLWKRSGNAGFFQLRWAALAVVGLLQAPAVANDDFGRLAERVPADAMAVWLGRPAPPEAASDNRRTIERLGDFLAVGRRMGLIPQRGQVLADILATLPLLGRYSHAVALLDVASQPVGNQGYRLAFLQAALVLDTRGNHDAVGRQIQHLLTAYTIDTHSRLVEVTLGEGQTCVRLLDDRLPDWCVIEWGVLGECFLVTVGRGGFERVVATSRHAGKSLQQNDWYRRSHARCHGSAAFLEILVDFERIERRLSAVVKGRPQAVLDRLGLSAVQRALYTTGRTGRAVTAYAVIRRQDKDQFIPLSDPDSYSRDALEAIHPQAPDYTILSLPIGKLIRRTWQAYLASQRPNRRERIQERWRELQDGLGVDVDRQILEHFGDELIIHTYPPHPLGVPILCTLMIEIREKPGDVRTATDALLSAWKRHLDQPAEPLETLGLRPRLMRADDGLWFFHVGLYGPALAVAEQWLVISFSPEAVRSNLRWLRTRPTSRSTGRESRR